MAILVGLARHEIRMTLRERAGWGAGVTACVLAFLDAALLPHLPIAGGLRASLCGGPLILAPLTIVFVSGAARRDDAFSAGDVIESTPYPAHWLSLARILGLSATTLFLYALVIVSSVLPSLLFAGRLPSPLTLIHAFVRGAVPLLYIVTLTYCAVLLARNVLAGAVVAVYWLFVLLWGDFLARIFNFALTQNWPTYTAVGAGVALGTLAIQRRIIRAEGGRFSALLPGAAVALICLGVLDAYYRVAHSHDKPLRQDPVMLQMAQQHIEASPRLPGFWLPDQHGRGFRISQAGRRVTVVGFWSPHIPASVELLQRLKKLSSEFPEDQVLPIAVCLSNDHAISPHSASEGGYSFPMVTDIGTHFAGKITDCSPIAEACVIQEVPYVFITDRARRVVASIGPGEAASAEHLAAEVQRALSVPAPPFVE